MKLFSFFQAEDGIRDIGVTGVQTCALPIYEPTTYAPPRGRSRVELAARGEPGGPRGRAAGLRPGVAGDPGPAYGAGQADRLDDRRGAADRRRRPRGGPRRAGAERREGGGAPAVRRRPRGRRGGRATRQNGSAAGR